LPGVGRNARFENRYLKGGAKCKEKNQIIAKRNFLKRRTLGEMPVLKTDI